MKIGRICLIPESLHSVLIACGNAAEGEETVVAAALVVGHAVCTSYMREASVTVTLRSTTFKGVHLHFLQALFSVSGWSTAAALPRPIRMVATKKVVSFMVERYEWLIWLYVIYGCIDVMIIKNKHFTRGQIAVFIFVCWRRILVVMRIVLLMFSCRVALSALSASCGSFPIWNI